MKLRNAMMALGGFCLLGGTSAQANLTYNFATDAQGFVNVTWQATDPAGWAGSPGSIKQAHTTGGWQMLQTKEFSWVPGGGDANQQTAMQALANLGANARLKFDVMVNGSSFPAGVAGWYELHIVGNSDGAAGWTQKENLFTVASWHNADAATLTSMQIDQPFSYFGWEPGDTWFQLWTGSNSAADFPVNFFLDNVVAYAVVPEPSTFALLGLGAAALLIRRRK